MMIYKKASQDLKGFKSDLLYHRDHSPSDIFFYHSV